MGHKNRDSSGHAEGRAAMFTRFNGMLRGTGQGNTVGRDELMSLRKSLAEKEGALYDLLTKAADDCNQGQRVGHKAFSELRTSLVDASELG